MNIEPRHLRKPQHDQVSGYIPSYPLGFDSTGLPKPISMERTKEQRSCFSESEMAARIQKEEKIVSQATCAIGMYKKQTSTSRQMKAGSGTSRILKCLREHPEGLTRHDLRALGICNEPSGPLTYLQKRGYIEKAGTRKQTTRGNNQQPVMVFRAIMEETA